MNSLPKIDLSKIGLARIDLPKVALSRVDMRRFGRLLALLLSLAVVAFLYAMVLTRGGIVR
ncbi:hypothetical protein ACFY1L_01750 [Streptomyces sp. NPDC001663]|uniref:hypothetical protein n=1 Tax=Streptomyces sp. NPDC001663 TaxID=3364597 RepID=UPI003680764B